MKHIFTDSKGMHLDRYFEYIKSLQSVLPPHVYSFASNPENYDLTSKSSLHDSWIESFEIREVSAGEIRISEISLCLLGAYHDRRIRLVYEGVQAYSAVTSKAEAGLGDLIVHEVWLEDNATLVHELNFVNGTITIKCGNFRNSEEKI